MRRLSDEQVARKEELVKELEEKYGEVQNALANYNQVLADVNDFRNEVIEEIQAHMDEKPESWADSDKGQEYQAWLDAWESFDTEEIDDPDEIKLDEVPDSP